MSTRRPRIKALANLAPKRKSGTDQLEVKNIKKDPLEEKAPEPRLKVEEEKTQSIDENLKPENEVYVPKKQKIEITESTLDDVAILPQESISESIFDNRESKTDNPFKFPQTLITQQTNLVSSDDKLDKSSEELIQQDLRRFAQGPQSPLKHRQRIRPTPCFGLRRNSMQGNSSDLEDEPKRQRYLSTSSTHSASAIQKIYPSTTNRIRTESSCSGLSDYNLSRDQSIKCRKGIASEDHQRITSARKEFQLRFNGKTPEKSLLKMFDLIYYNPTTNPMTSNNNTSIAEKLDNIGSRRASVNSQAPAVPEEAEEKADDIISQDKLPISSNDALPVPQLKLGPNGEMILDEKSLVIETTADKEARSTLASSNVIYMDEYSGNNGFYRRQKRTKNWSAEETIKFYRCLHTIGTDFSLMLTLFPNRTRRDLKLKFNKEERYNLALVNKALLYPKKFNIDELKIELEKEEQEAAEKRKQWEEMKKKTLTQKSKKDLIKSNSNEFSKCARALKDGNFAYENELYVPSAKPKIRKKMIGSKCSEFRLYKNENRRAAQNISKSDQNTLLSNNSIDNDEVFDEVVEPTINSTAIINKNIHAISNISENITDSINSEYLSEAEKDYKCDKLVNLVTSGDITSSEILAILEKDLNDETLVKSQNAVCDIKLEKSAFSGCTDSNIGQKSMDSPEKIQKGFNCDLNTILTDIANGSLVVVSSEDQDDTSKVINEVYVMCKETGQLSDNPLDLSEDVINCIMEACN